MDIEQWTQNIINATASFWNKIAAFLPNLVATIVILVVGVILVEVVVVHHSQKHKITQQKLAM